MLFGNRPGCEQLCFETFYNHHFGSLSWQAWVHCTVLKLFDLHRFYHSTLFVKMTDLILEKSMLLKIKVEHFSISKILPFAVTRHSACEENLKKIISGRLIVKSTFENQACVELDDI